MRDDRRPVDIVAASEPTPGQANEDVVITGPSWALVLDGTITRRDGFYVASTVADWTELLDLLTDDGPAELIRRTRHPELAETEGERAGRRGKKHDDATAVLVSHFDER